MKLLRIITLLLSFIVTTAQTYTGSGTFNGTFTLTTTPTPTHTATPVPPTPTPIPTPTAVAHFVTQPPHAVPPAESWCAQQVDAIPIAEVVPSNTPFNGVFAIPTSAQLAAFHVNPQPFKGDKQGIPQDYANADGNYAGSTDMLIRDAACKWGIDEDVIRAQAENESGGWFAYHPGDKRASPPLTLAQAQSACVQPQYPQLQIWNTTVQLPGSHAILCPNCCWQSWGITQNKLYYEPTAWQMAANSTMFTLDLTYAEERSCMNGNFAIYFASAQQQPNTYAADIASGNVQRILWGCVGKHFSGGWYDSGAQSYIASVQLHLSRRDWP
jgi:hypothetical protein